MIPAVRRDVLDREISLKLEAVRVPAPRDVALKVQTGGVPPVASDLEWIVVLPRPRILVELKCPLGWHVISVADARRLTPPNHIGSDG